MANVVAIVQDDRVRKQVEQYLQQLGIDDLRFATFKYVQEFVNLYFRDKTEDEQKQGEDAPPEQNKEDDSGVDLRLFSEINVLIFALDSIGEKSGPFIDKLRVNLKRFKHWPEAGPVRLIMLKYEDDGLTKLDVMHPLLDDLIYLPLDRLVFLQKMEIIIALPKVVRPRFLFSQEVRQDIEISKITKLDRLSDVGLAIRNPMPLKKGLPGHFYIQLPGEKQRLGIKGKVFRSEPHPDFPGQYLVYFSYFALPKADLTAIRRVLSKAARYQSLYNDDRTVFRYRPDDLFLNTGDQKVFGIAVIDPDPQQANALAQQIGKDMDRLKLVSETSLSLFVHRYFENTQSSGKPSRPTEDKDFYWHAITLNVSVSDLKLMSIDPPPGKDDKFLGHAAFEIFANPERWLNLLTDKASKVVLEESAQLATMGRTSEKLLTLQDWENNPRAVNVKIHAGPSESIAALEIRPASLLDISAKTIREEANKDLDAMIVDSAFVPEDPAGWIDGLRNRAYQMGRTKEVGGLKFLVVAEQDARISEKWLNNPDILGVLIKPVDTRQLGFLLSENLPNKNTVYQYENLGWAQPNLPIHVAKTSQLEALSEFGATLKSRQQLVPGTIIYLRKSIYDKAPYQCLASRVYACTDHPSEKGAFQVLTTYFGIGDVFLKFARTWIRENYATQKTKENG